MYIRFQLTVRIIYEYFFVIIFLWFTAHHHLTQHIRRSVHPSVRPSGNVVMLRHVYAYLYVGPAKDFVMGLSVHDQTFAFRMILTVII